MGIGKKTNQPEGDSQNNRSIGIDPDDLQAATSSVKPQEDMTKWLDDKAWKQPKWLKRTNADKPKNQGFQNFYLNSLRARYLRLEGDFRTAYSNFYNSPYMDCLHPSVRLPSQKPVLLHNAADISKPEIGLPNRAWL